MAHVPSPYKHPQQRPTVGGKKLLKPKIEPSQHESNPEESEESEEEQVQAHELVNKTKGILSECMEEIQAIMNQTAGGLPRYNAKVRAREVDSTIEDLEVIMDAAQTMMEHTCAMSKKARKMHKHLSQKAIAKANKQRPDHMEAIREVIRAEFEKRAVGSEAPTPSQSPKPSRLRVPMMNM